MELTERRGQLSKEAKQAIAEKNRATRIIVREQLLSESGLSEESKTRLRKAFPGDDLGGLKQAINVERRNQK